MAWTDILTSVLGDVASSAAKTVFGSKSSSSGGGGGGGSTASAQAAATQQALTIDTGSERSAEATYRKGIQSTSEGFVSKSTPAAQVQNSDAQRALAALVSPENRQSFHTAMIQQQQAAQSGGPRNIG
jgi:hypothetical protein